MSGPQSQALAGAALGHALRAEATNRGYVIGQVVRERLLESLGKHKPEKKNLPAMTWKAIPEKTRLLIVMIGTKTAGEPQRLCRQPWESFSAEDRARMAASARELARDLRDVSSLF
jgi:hypothetical protein